MNNVSPFQWFTAPVTLPSAKISEKKPAELSRNMENNFLHRNPEIIVGSTAFGMSVGLLSKTKMIMAFNNSERNKTLKKMLGLMASLKKEYLDTTFQKLKGILPSADFSSDEIIRKNEIDESIKILKNLIKSERKEYLQPPVKKAILVGSGIGFAAGGIFSIINHFQKNTEDN